jgi:PAT family beta-lactamase induction signal transducer AmpG
MRLPNLLASRNGRLAAFFLLYVTEGIPLGFAATAVAAQLRRMGVGPAEIGAFVASFYLPWAFKWAYGPLVDVFRSRRFGHRRAWILGTQLIMAVTLLALLWVPLPQALALFTAVLLVHNSFAAMQDVAIDALAVNTLGEHERGLANGLMFAGASLGQAVGGAGVLFIAGYTGFHFGFVFVAAAILAVTAFVVLPMKEALAEPEANAGWREAIGRMRGFAEESFRSFLGSRGAYAGVFFALLPTGAMSLSLAPQTNLAVELGMNDDRVALLSLLSVVISGASMVIGGLASDRLGHRRMLALYVALMSLPALYLAWVLQQAGYVMPRAPGSAPREDLITQFWIATLSFNVALGLMYGTRSAVFMDITNPRVAATQFTAYMAMLNLAIAFSATWHGIAIEALGYPITLMFDAAAGVLCLALLPALGRPRGQDRSAGDGRADRRARAAAIGLGLMCFGFALWWLRHDPKGPAIGIANTVFTLAFVVSALFLVASSLMQAWPGAAKRACRLLALALLLLYLRRFIDPAMPFAAALQALVALVAVAGGVALLVIARRPWRGLQASTQSA